MDIIFLSHCDLGVMFFTMGMLYAPRWLVSRNFFVLIFSIFQLPKGLYCAFDSLFMCHFFKSELYFFEYFLSF
jgi:hypothetical protein